MKKLVILAMILMLPMTLAGCTGNDMIEKPFPGSDDGAVLTIPKMAP